MPPRVSRGRAVNVRRKQRGNKQRKGNGSGSIIGANDVPGLVNTTFSVFPRSKRVSLRYSDSQSVSGTFTAGNQVWGLNCLYDPNISGTGSQPMGFDQMMVFFEHYTVTSCRIKLTLQNQTAGANAAVFARVDGDVTPITDFYRLGELGMTTELLLTPFGTAGSIGVLEKVINIRTFLGVRNLVDEFEARGSIAANPAEGVYLHTAIANPAGVTTVTVLTYITMEFSAIFTEPRNVTRSLQDLRLNRDHPDAVVVHRPPSESKHPCCNH